MKKQSALLISVCLIALTGCSQRNDVVSRQLNSYIEDSIMKESSIQTDESYARYEQISKNETVNEEGFFVSDDVDYSVLEDTDTVHVTFAVNSYIKVQYFDDPGMTSPLDAGGTYLHVNDCIYANIEEIDNPNTDAYQFGGFEVWEYDENGKKKNELETSPFEDNLVYQIPMNYNGKEISIVPLGEYTSRTITLNDYYKDNNGVERELAGTWKVNGDETTYNSASVGPVTPYTVTYKYDPNLYVFVNSEPTCFHNDEEDGTVSFEEISADQNNNSFSVELRPKSGDQEFDPNKYMVEHADITYKYQGVVIDEPKFIPNGSKISYEITRVDSGYWVPRDMKGEVEVGDVAEVLANLVCKEEKVKVMIPQPDRGGTITYSLDGKTLTGDSVEALIGSEIKMTFTCRDGWTCEAEDGTVYKIVETEKEEQIINVNGKDVNDIFTEAQQYKPTVSLTLDKTVGTDIEFDLIAVDVNKTGLKLDSDKKEEVFKEKVGTEKDLVLVASGSKRSKEALKVEIKNETFDGTKEIDIRYLQKLPGRLTVPLYISDYKSVNLAVSRVEVEDFENPNIENGIISVETIDITNNRYLRAGDVIEGSRKVKFSISAKSGYYVKDSGKTEVYADTMKYSKYASDIQSILTKHPVKKLYSVTLDSEDEYGTVAFKIDGKVVDPGVHKLKEEQKLEISYEITDGGYVIAREGSNWLEDRLNDVQSKTKQTIEVPITPSLDGGIVTRDKYINIKAK